MLSVVQKLRPCCSQPHPHYNPTDTCCEIYLLCAKRQKVRGKKVGEASSSLCCGLQSVESKNLSKILPELSLVWRRDEGCTVVRSSHPQTSPPSVQPTAIWRSSIPQRSPEEPVPAAADRLEGSQPGVRGPVRDFPTQPKQFPFLSKGHFNSTWSFPHLQYDSYI